MTARCPRRGPRAAGGGSVGLLQRLELVAQPGGSLVGLVADRGLEPPLQLAHALAPLHRALVETRHPTGVTRGTVDALEQIAQLRHEDLVIARAAEPAALAELGQGHAAIRTGQAELLAAALSRG